MEQNLVFLRLVICKRDRLAIGQHKPTAVHYRDYPPALLGTALSKNASALTPA